MEQLKKWGLALYLGIVGAFFSRYVIPWLASIPGIWGDGNMGGGLDWMKKVDLNSIFNEAKSAYIDIQSIEVVIIFTLLVATIFILQEIKGFSFKKTILYVSASGVVAYGSVWLIRIYSIGRWSLRYYLGLMTVFAIIVCACIIIQALQATKENDKKAVEVIKWSYVLLYTTINHLPSFFLFLQERTLYGTIKKMGISALFRYCGSFFQLLYHAMGSNDTWNLGRQKNSG